jgi:hypothetical protein
MSATAHRNPFGPRSARLQLLPPAKTPWSLLRCCLDVDRSLWAPPRRSRPPPMKGTTVATTPQGFVGQHPGDGSGRGLYEEVGEGQGRDGPTQCDTAAWRRNQGRGPAARYVISSHRRASFLY